MGPKVDGRISYSFLSDVVNHGYFDGDIESETSENNNNDGQSEKEVNKQSEKQVNSLLPLLRRKIMMAVTKLQVMLNDLLIKHKASLLLYDEICELFNSYLASPYFDRFAKLKSRKSLLRYPEKTQNTECLQPINGTVRLHDNALVTVPVFDTKHMIISLLNDPSLMKEQNFAEGYNVFTGEVHNHPDNNKYGEVHTGDAWLPARNRYCQNMDDMLVALIIFADKSHTNLHGALSLMPIIFTLTLFNCAARTDAKF